MKLYKQKLLTSALALALALPALAAAQETARLELQTAPDGTGILTDSAGFTLYAFAEESDGQPACTDECTDTWLPLLSEGRAVAGPGVIPGLIGTVERAEGTQVMFMNRPLYRYVNDAEAGSFAGQGIDGSWYTVTQTGALHTAELGGTPASEDETAEAATFELDKEVMLAGQQTFGNFCAMCHGVDGSGGAGGPSLVNRDILAGTPYVAAQILYGGSEMPGFKGALSDEDIARTATYIRNSFGNSHGPVTAEEVAAAH